MLLVQLEKADSVIVVSNSNIGILRELLSHTSDLLDISNDKLYNSEVKVLGLESDVVKYKGRSKGLFKASYKAQL